MCFYLHHGNKEATSCFTERDDPLKKKGDASQGLASPGRLAVRSSLRCDHFKHPLARVGDEPSGINDRLT